MTPTQRTLKFLRSQGWVCQVVEHWNPFAHIKQDLFQWIDIVAVKEGEPIFGIQTTSSSNHSARIKKAHGNKALWLWLQTGRLAVISWSKKKGKWEPRIEYLKRER